MYGLSAYLGCVCVCEVLAALSVVLLEGPIEKDEPCARWSEPFLALLGRHFEELGELAYSSG